MNVAVTATNPNNLAPGVLLADNLLPLTAPANLHLANVTVTAEITGTDSNPTIRIHCVGGVAMYVWLSTLADGRFEDNGFLMLSNTVQEIFFIPFQHFDAQVLQASL